MQGLGSLGSVYYKLPEQFVKKIREAHSNMVKTYEGKLSEFGIPVEELGFDPLVPANI